MAGRHYDASVTERLAIGPIAIDGPAASGKSSVGIALARRLGFGFLDTGLMYRAVALAALRAGIPATDAEGCARLAEQLPLRVEATPDGTTVWLGDEDVTGALRDEAVETSVSAYSAIPGVRTAMVARQREIAAPGNMILAGRDIGTVVLPDAPVKLFLDASEAERAQRRARQAEGWGQPASPERSREHIRGRDEVDSSRAASPLAIASDALVIDTTGLTLDAVVERAMEAVTEAAAAAGAEQDTPASRRRTVRDRSAPAPRRAYLRPFVGPFYWLCWALLKVLVFVIARFRCEGRDRIPRSGPLIVASNHLNNIDPIILVPAIGRARRIRWMAKVELFRGPFGFFAHLFGAFPLRRFEGDLSAVLTAERILRAGGTVGMFPEGTRSRVRTLQSFHPGTAALALRTGATILPCGVVGTERLGKVRNYFLRPRITIRIGEPIEVKRTKRPTADEVSALTERLREAISALLPPQYGGTYTA